MKVLAISSYGALGGAELASIEFLSHRPDDVEAAVLLVEDGPLRERLEPLGLPIWAAGDRYDGRPTASGMAHFSRSLGRLLRDVEPDVVWATGLKAASMALPACKLGRVPVVWHKVDFSLDSVLTRPLAAAVDGVVSVSAAVAEALGPLRRRRLLAVLGTPVRLPVELEIDPNVSRPTIGTLASLIPIKGQRHIIEAAALLAEEFPRIRVLLAGSASPDYPDYPDELRRLADSVGIGDGLELVGFVEDVTEVLGELSVFVNATYRAERHFGREGLGSSMLEASWAGLPVVATRGGGSPEGLRDGQTGTLVDPANPAELAAAAARYLRDPQLARATGAAGRRFTRERFAPQTLAARLFDALREVARPYSG